MPKNDGNFVVMGIDPSLTSTGYAFLEFSKNKFNAIEYGTVETHPSQNLHTRLAKLFNTISALIEENKPREVAVEDVFFSKNAKSALLLGQARGALLVAASSRNLAVAEYTPREIKMAVSGYGNASKEQMRRMVLSQVDLKNSNIKYDVSDACAVAICHFHRMKHRIK